MNEWMNDKLPPLLTRFRKNRNTQHCLLTMLEKWEAWEAVLKAANNGVNINSSFRAWEIILIGVPLGSIRGPLLFNILLNDLFLVAHSHLTKYVDGNTLYCFGNNMNNANDKLWIDSLSNGVVPKLRGIKYL